MMIKKILVLALCVGCSELPMMEGPQASMAQARQLSGKAKAALQLVVRRNVINRVPEFLQSHFENLDPEKISLEPTDKPDVFRFRASAAGFIAFGQVNATTGKMLAFNINSGPPPITW